MRGEKGVDDALVLVGEHAARRVDERPPGFTSVAAEARIAACFAVSSARAASVWRHLRSGLRRSVPKARARGVDEDAIELSCQPLDPGVALVGDQLRVHVGQPRPGEPRLQGSRAAWPTRRTRTGDPASASALRAAGTSRRRRRRSRRPCRAASARRASPRAGCSRPGSPASRPADKGCRVGTGRPATAQASGEKGGRCGAMPVATQRGLGRFARRLQRIHAEVERRGTSHARASAARSFLPPKRVPAEPRQSQSGRSAATAGGSSIARRALKLAQPVGVHARAAPGSRSRTLRPRSRTATAAAVRTGAVVAPITSEGPPAPQVGEHAFADECAVLLSHLRMRRKNGAAARRPGAPRCGCRPIAAGEARTGWRDASLAGPSSRRRGSASSMRFDRCPAVSGSAA